MNWEDSVPHVPLDASITGTLLEELRYDKNRYHALYVAGLGTIEQVMQAEKKLEDEVARLARARGERLEALTEEIISVFGK